ncbi:MAG: hypothetical protein L0271_26395 [Gemmatimonadetes bacterium]|nr:hypothetical protein [Gemmatimonadota bacterium]
MRRLLDRLTNDLLLKVTALGLAFLLWSLVKEDSRVPITDIPIEVVNGDAAWVLAATPDPPVVRVTFSGPVRELFRVAAERPTILVPIDRVSDSTQVVVLRPEWVSLGDGLGSTRIEEIRPAAVRLVFERMITRTIPLAVRVTGVPVPGFELAGGPLVDPPAVLASGPGTRLAGLDSLRLPPIDLVRRNVTDTIVVPIDTTGLGIIVTPREARVIVPIRPVTDTVDAQPGTGRTAGS